MSMPSRLYELRSNQVFISYAHDDKVVVEKLYKNLCQKRLNLWWDQTHLEQQNVDHLLEEVIQLEIQKSMFVILCLSENWQNKVDSDRASGFVTHEFKLVLNQKRKSDAFKVIALYMDSRDYALDDMKPDLRANISNGLQVCVDSIHEYISRSIEMRSTDNDIIADKCRALYWRALDSQSSSPDVSLHLIDEALSISPNYYDGWTSKGSILNILRRPEEAIECFKKAIEINPLCYEAWNNMSVSFYSLSRCDDAIYALNKTLSLVDTAHDPWVDKCLNLIKLGKFNDALETIEVGLPRIKYPHGLSRLWNAKGYTFFHLKEYEMALAAYEEAMELDPAFHEPRQNHENLTRHMEEDSSGQLGWYFGDFE